MKLKHRKIIAQIETFLLDKKVIVLHGSRQVGKTSIMKYLINKLSSKYKVLPKDIFYLDLEDFTFLDICSSGPRNLIQYLEDKYGVSKKKRYIFIDEIQYLENPTNFLKLFADHFQNFKLIVSGSSSFEIKKKFKDSLVGRTINFEIFPLDFEEFLFFQGKKIKNLTSKVKVVVEELKKLYIEYAIFGGYPEIVLEKNKNKKTYLLKQIINTYLRKDIRDLANIKQMHKFNRLLRVLADQAGSLLNILELSNTLKLSQATVENYLFILENTYIIRRIYPYYKNIRSELTKHPKIYFEDTGLANLLKNNFLLEKLDGHLLENSLYSEFRKNNDIENINFWRTNTGQEIDFIITKNKPFPIEVKMKFLNKNSKNLRYFMKKYQSSNAYFCTLEKIEESNKSNIKVIYPWQIIKLLFYNP